MLWWTWKTVLGVVAVLAAVAVIVYFLIDTDEGIPTKSPSAPKANANVVVPMPAEHLKDGKFGSGLGMSGDGQFLFVAAPSEAVGEQIGAGAVYVYQNAGSGQWTFRTRMTRPTPDGYEDLTEANFGAYIAADYSGNYAVVSAYNVTEGISASIHVYRRADADGTTWNLVQSDFNEGVNDSRFGANCSFNKDGSIMAVPEPRMRSTLGGGTRDEQPYGAVHIYKLTGSAYVRSYTILPPADAVPDVFFYFGWAYQPPSFSDSGTSLQIPSAYEGSTVDATVLNRTGSIYEYALDSETDAWALVRKISSVSPVASDIFGHFHTRNGAQNRMAVGTHYSFKTETSPGGEGHIEISNESGELLQLLRSPGDASRESIAYTRGGGHMTKDGVYLTVCERNYNTVYRYKWDGTLYQLVESVVQDENVENSFATSMTASDDGQYIVCGNQSDETPRVVSLYRPR